MFRDIGALENTKQAGGGVIRGWLRYSLRALFVPSPTSDEVSYAVIECVLACSDRFGPKFCKFSCDLTMDDDLLFFFCSFQTQS